MISFSVSQKRIKRQECQKIVENNPITLTEKPRAATNLSYSITSFAPVEINNKFLAAKNTFRLLIDQKKTKEENVITKNTAHISIKRAYYLKEGASQEAMVSSVKEVHSHSVVIVANRLKVFKTQKYGNVLAVLIDKSPDIAALHKNILYSLQQYVTADSLYENNAFTPHLSVLYYIPDTILDETIAYAEEYLLPISFRLDNLNILQAVPNVKNERSFIWSQQLQS